jgi:hypothetical protein
MPETPEEVFARLMPGYDIKQARRTKKGNPYVHEAGEFELAHELEHVDQLYAPGGMEAIDEGYDEPRMSRLYSTFGLPSEDAGWLAYANRPSELAARKAAGDPDERFKELMAQIAQLRARRLGRK